MRVITCDYLEIEIAVIVFIVIRIGIGTRMILFIIRKIPGHTT